MPNKTLPFSYNWNNKLNCKSFSTVRIFNPNKYVLLEDYDVVLSGKKGEPAKKLGVARLQAQHHFLLDKVSPAVAFLDANLNRTDFILMVQKMYKNSKIDFSKKKMSFLVFQYVEKS
nr:hypothetical protein [uncultured Draconibacterium sp.]